MLWQQLSWSWSSTVPTTCDAIIVNTSIVPLNFNETDEHFLLQNILDNRFELDTLSLRKLQQLRR